MKDQIALRELPNLKAMTILRSLEILRSAIEFNKDPFNPLYRDSLDTVQKIADIINVSRERVIKHGVINRMIDKDVAKAIISSYTQIRDDIHTELKRDLDILVKDFEEQMNSTPKLKEVFINESNNIKLAITGTMCFALEDMFVGFYNNMDPWENEDYADRDEFKKILTQISARFGDGEDLRSQEILLTDEEAKVLYKFLSSHSKHVRKFDSKGRKQIEALTADLKKKLSTS